MYFHKLLHKDGSVGGNQIMNGQGGGGLTLPRRLDANIVDECAW